MRRVSAERMKCYWLICLAFAGNAIASTPPSPIDINRGEEFSLSALTLTSEVSSCYIITPSGEKVVVVPDNGPIPERMKPQSPNDMFGCRVLVTGASEEDIGVWEIHATTSLDRDITNSYAVTVRRDNNNPSLFDDEDVEWLPQLMYTTQTGSQVSIALNKKDYHEDCSVLSPDGNIKSFSEAEKTGIKTFGSNDFVACRIVIGPIDGTHIGNWSLCGTHDKNGDKVIRCQGAQLEWHLNSVSNRWVPEVKTEVKHVVHYGMRLTPTVRDFGQNMISCHVITPSGDDIQLTEESDFNGIVRVGSSQTQCQVAIGPIGPDYLGDWTVYALFRSFMGIDEIRQPMHLVLFDAENPYNQAYNVSSLDTLLRVINLGTTINQRLESRGQTNGCYLKSPSGQEYDIVSAKTVEGVSLVAGENAATCDVAIGPVNEAMLGEWTLTGKFNNNDIFTELRQPINIVQEDPANPIEDELERRIVILREESFNTDMGASHNVFIDQSNARNECYIITPNKHQYRLMEGFNVPGVQILEGNDICGVTISVISEELIGEWMIFSRRLYLGSAMEWRIPFTIKVEENVGVFPVNTYIAEGNDLYIRLENPTHLSETCVLVGPDGEQAEEFEYDNHYREWCGFIVHNMSSVRSGSWKIVFGNTITYIATSHVHVVGRWEQNTLHYTWTEDRPLNVTIGPENAVYCKVEDQNNIIVFEGFGRCIISLPRVTSEHTGIWKMVVATPGRVLADVTEFSVTVQKPGSRGYVLAEVSSEDSDVLLSCKLVGDETKDVTACKLRDPSGRLLLANSGVGEDRYLFHGTERSVFSTFQNQTCGLRIRKVTASDLGVWRCAMETEDHEAYFGFLTVNFPWIEATDAQRAELLHGPILQADRVHIESVEGDSVTMSCSISQPIHYCYVRFSNGTTFAAGYNTGTGSVEYVGAGLDSGECAVRFPSLWPRDSGRWSCHVGFHDNQPEQRQFIQVEVKEKLAVSQTLLEDNVVEIRAEVYGDRPIEYCRFVRIDGFGFMGHHLPEGFASLSDAEKSNTSCGLRSLQAGMLEFHPWTVAVKLVGDTFEISRQTPSSFPASVPTPPPAPEYDSQMAVSQTLLEDNVVEIRAEVYGDRPIEYCRFVRIDGFDFMGHDLPEGFASLPDAEKSNTLCGIRSLQAGMLEFHPWTVAVKLVGDTSEISRRTNSSFPASVLPTPPPEHNSQKLAVSQTLLEDNVVEIRAEVYGDRPIEYCRFVRIDGFDFMGHDLPEGFASLPDAEKSNNLCGIRSLQAGMLEFHPWTVAVKLVGDTSEISRRTNSSFPASVLPTPPPEHDSEKLAVSQTLLEDNVVEIRAEVYGDRPIEYCRFVRIDGFDFMGHDLPEGFASLPDAEKSNTLCGIRSLQAGMLEFHPWTVAVKLVGDTSEISRRTNSSFPASVLPTPPPEHDSQKLAVSQTLLEDNVVEIRAEVYGDRPIEYCRFVRIDGFDFMGHDLPEGFASLPDAEKSNTLCGIRSLQAGMLEFHPWTVAVKLVGDTSEISRRTNSSFPASVLPTPPPEHDSQKLAVSQTLLEDNVVEIRAEVYGDRHIEYCRFVRIDGFAFMGHDLPEGFASLPDAEKSNNVCGLRSLQAGMLEFHPWTVAVKLVGDTSEISRRTNSSFPASVLPTPPPVPEENPPPQPAPEHNSRHWYTSFWIMLLSITMTICLMGVLMGPRKNREWTRSRVVMVRSSFRNSFKKPPLPAANNTTNMAA